MKKLIILLLIFCHPIAWSGQMTSQTRGMILHAPMNGNSRDYIKDRTRTDIGVYFASGMHGKCFYSPSSSRTTYAAVSSDFALGNSYTIGVSIKRIDYGSGNIAWAQGTNTSDRHYLQFWGSLSAPVIAYVIFNSGNLWYLNPAFPNFAINRWYRVIITHSGTYVCMYINGRLVSSGNTTYTIGSWSSRFGLGTDSVFSGGSTYYTGYLDDFFILNRPMSSGEVMADYINGIGVQHE